MSMTPEEYKEHLKKKCLDCGHLPCEGCGDWCDMLANHVDYLKHVNIVKFLKDLTPDELKEWNTDKSHDEWYPILCCEGECRYE